MTVSGKVRLTAREIRNLIEEALKSIDADRVESSVRYGRITFQRMLRYALTLCDEVEMLEALLDEARGRTIKYIGPKVSDLQRKIDDADIALQLHRHTDDCMRASFMNGRAGGRLNPNDCLPACKNHHAQELSKLRR